MAADPVNQNMATIAAPYPTCMESVNRLSKLPVVECTIQTATSIYEKVKDYNNITNWTLCTAENMGTIALEVSKPITTPVIRNLEGPIKKVDSVLCTGLDYVENKVPAVKLPPGEIYTSTKDYVNNTVYPAVECARTYAEPAVKTAKDLVEPAVGAALTAVEPAVDMAKHYVEPYVQPAIDTVTAVKENVMHKVDEYLHRSHNHEGNFKECQECQKVKQELEKQRLEQQKND